MAVRSVSVPLILTISVFACSSARREVVSDTQTPKKASVCAIGIRDETGSTPVTPRTNLHNYNGRTVRAVGCYSMPEFEDERLSDPDNAEAYMPLAAAQSHEDVLACTGRYVEIVGEVHADESASYVRVLSMWTLAGPWTCSRH